MKVEQRGRERVRSGLFAGGRMSGQEVMNVAYVFVVSSCPPESEARLGGGRSSWWVTERCPIWLTSACFDEANRIGDEGYSNLRNRRERSW